MIRPLTRRQLLLWQQIHDKMADEVEGSVLEVTPQASEMKVCISAQLYIEALIAVESPLINCNLSGPACK